MWRSISAPMPIREGIDSSLSQLSLRSSSSPQRGGWRSTSTAWLCSIATEVRMMLRTRTSRSSQRSVGGTQASAFLMIFTMSAAIASIMEFLRGSGLGFLLCESVSQTSCLPPYLFPKSRAHRSHQGCSQICEERTRTPQRPQPEKWW